MGISALDQNYTGHYNTSVRNLYANNMCGHLVRSAVQHLKRCIQCNEEMFPDHLTSTEATAISKGIRPTFMQKGHLTHCEKCREASIRNYNSIFELIFDQVKQILSRLFRRRRRNG